jgi:uncharacterized protein YndB with AHSA1/START domain
MNPTKRNVTRVQIKGTIQEVWDALTRQGEPLPFFFGSVMHTTGLHPGAQIRMRTDCDKYTGVVGEILEVNAPYKFSHTFKFTHVDDPPCKVTYELKEIEGGVEFTLISEDIPAGTRTEKDMVAGARIIVDTLKGMIEDGRPPFKSRFILLMCRLTKFMTPGKSLTSRWPLDKPVV